MKQALCVARHDVATLIKFGYSRPNGEALEVYNPEQPMTLLTPMPHGFLEEYETSLLNREWCETNPTYLQLLPYIVLLSEDGIFMYRRGKGGKEDRLHDLYSIGVGGHIEEKESCDQTTSNVIAETIRREIQEEVGIVMTDDEFATLATHTDRLWFLYSDKDQVGSVHLGLTIGMIFSRHRFGQSEDNVITDGEFVTIEEIKEGGYQLEQWSQLLVGLFDKSINEEVPDEAQFPFFSFSELYRPMDTVSDVNVVYPKETTDSKNGVAPGSENTDDGITRGSDFDQA